jgi:hypothetical protein
MKKGYEELKVYPCSACIIIIFVSRIQNNYFHQLQKVKWLISNYEKFAFR